MSCTYQGLLRSGCLLLVVKVRSYHIVTGCDGRTALDGFDWEDARFIAPGVVYPEVPTAGAVYPIPEEYLCQLVEPRSVERSSRKHVGGIRTP